MSIEVLPAIIAAVIVVALTLSLLKTYRRALKAEDRAHHAESEMRKIMKYRGITRRDLDELDGRSGLGRTN